MRVNKQKLNRLLSTGKNVWNSKWLLKMCELVMCAVCVCVYGEWGCIRLCVYQLPM